MWDAGVGEWRRYSFGDLEERTEKEERSRGLEDAVEEGVVVVENFDPQTKVVPVPISNMRELESFTNF
jgi:hypothetical protein